MTTGQAYKRPESVLVLIHHGPSVLLLRRVDDPDFWQSVTGSLDWGETPSAAAQRELLEETGIDGCPQDLDQQARFVLRASIRHRYGTDQPLENLEHWFMLSLAHKPNIRLSAYEHSEYVWLPRSEAAERCWSPSNAEAILQNINAE